MSILEPGRYPADPDDVFVGTPGLITLGCPDCGEQVGLPVQLEYSITVLAEREWEFTTETGETDVQPMWDHMLSDHGPTP